jgi:hypothetical protein
VIAGSDSSLLSWFFADVMANEAARGWRVNSVIPLPHWNRIFTPENYGRRARLFASGRQPAKRLVSNQTPEREF